MLDIHKVKHRTIEVEGVTLFYREAGSPDSPGLLLLHGYPNSSYYFREVMSPLAKVARVVAPDLPGSGFTEVPDGYEYTFETIGGTIDVFARVIGLERFFLYAHDFGAPVAYQLALTQPDRVLGLIVQNGNSHEEGLGKDWDAPKAFWADPTPGNRAALPNWMNFEGVRDQYLNTPKRLKPMVAPEGWHFDWERLSRPGRTDVQFGIFTDYGRHVARFAELSAYHREHQPRTLVLWGRHDRYFEVDEVLAYHRELDRLDAHILDGGHSLLETHAPECAALMREFITDTA